MRLRAGRPALSKGGEVRGQTSHCRGLTEALKVDSDVARLAGTKAGVDLAAELARVVLLQLQLH